MLRFARMTILCRNLDASLRFYRDTLGLAVVEEKTLSGAAAGALLQLPPCRMRAALLAPTPADPLILGLFEVSGTPMGASRVRRDQPLYGQCALVLDTDEFEAVATRLVAAGVSVLTPPVRYPKTEASARSPAGLYREMIVHDPDSVLVSVIQEDTLPAGAP
jgi:catechol 2,3-dioxygenase-like lactoylglutathione lyase family enzyme